MIVGLFGLALLVSEPASTSAPTAQPAASAATAVKPKEEKICRVDTSDSTSRLRKRVCLTQTEWDRKEAGEDSNDLRNKGAR